VFLLRLLIITFVIAGLSSAGVYFFYSKSLDQSLALPNEGLVLEIKKGETLNSVLSGLKEQGIVKHLWPAKIYSRLNALGSQIKAGEFKLSSPMTVPQLLQFISSNNQITYSIQFIEGSTYKDALLVLANHEKILQRLTGLSDDEIVKKLNLEYSTHLEGQFYPDTYHFHKGDSDLDILKRANQRLKTILDSEWQSRQKDLPLENAYQALILASIIEKETGVPVERPEIAGVFIRRLQQKMRLQTDPTVIYGLGDSYQGNITRKHLQQDTPYNTYRISALPPTPIALVGRAAINAALNPKPGNSLYFVAKGDGSHYFSETIEEHNKAVREFQLKRRSDYRSSAQ
tara:strand:- start:1343 stop:2374 length:1032 start_codon:yes stop_codon:yes gene_type:complete